MKKILYFLFLIPIGIFAQTNSITLYLGCYTNGDTIPTKALQQLTDFNFGLLTDTDGNETHDFFMESFKMYIYNNGKFSVFSYNSNDNKASEPIEITPDCKQAMIGNNAKIPDKIVLEEINVLHFTEGNEISRQKVPNVIFYRRSKTFKECDEDISVKQITYEGKLLMGAQEKEPLKNQKVILTDDKNKELQSSVTDKYGDFSFKNVETSKSYKIEVPDNGTKIKDGQIFIAKQDGTIINSLKKSGKFFVYELLPTELHTIAKEKEEDAELKIADFSSSKQTELTVVENIYYAPNSIEINKESKEKLDKIIIAMQKNKTIKLAIVSHTDSKGDDASNMTLSEKRAQKVLEYFLAKGISKERLSAKGYGETQLKNRCKNGIDCSEKEHELNRRTEFKFSK